MQTTTRRGHLHFHGVAHRAFRAFRARRACRGDGVAGESSCVAHFGQIVHCGESKSNAGCISHFLHFYGSRISGFSCTMRLPRRRRRVRAIVLSRISRKSCTAADRSRTQDGFLIFYIFTASGFSGFSGFSCTAADWGCSMKKLFRQIFRIVSSMGLGERAVYRAVRAFRAGESRGSEAAACESAAVVHVGQIVHVAAVRFRSRRKCFAKSSKSIHGPTNGHATFFRQAMHGVAGRVRENSG